MAGDLVDNDLLDGDLLDGDLLDGKPVGSKRKHSLRKEAAMAKTGLYQAIDLQARVGTASPYQLITLMYEGLLSSLTGARLALVEGDLEAKSRCLSKAIGILNGLRDSLDTELESDLPHNVLLLYNYMISRLLEAGRQLDCGAVEEVSQLVLTIKSGWDRIDPAARD